MSTIDLTPKLSVKSSEQEMAASLIAGERGLGESLGGLQFYSNGFKRGYGNNVFGVSEEGGWFGNANFIDAPLQLWYNGHIKASDIDLTGSGYTKLTIFKQASIPTSVAIGDLWFDTDDSNKMYRAAIAGADAITVGEWELVVPTAISVFAQTSVPTALAVGDLWYDTDDNNKVYRAASAGADAITAGEWVLVNDLRAADALLKASTSQTLSGTFNVGSASVKIDGANSRIIVNDGADRVIIDANGITINDGKITLKNSSTSTILDSYGLVSLSSFVNTATVNSYIYTTSGSFVEVTGAAMTFTNVRSAVFLIMLNCQVRMAESGGNTGNGMISIFIDGVEQSNGINIATGVNNYICQSLQLLRELAAGSHTITVKARLQTIYAGAPEFRADAVQFSYIRFGV